MAGIRYLDVRQSFSLAGCDRTSSGNEKHFYIFFNKKDQQLFSDAGANDAFIKIWGDLGLSEYQMFLIN